MSEYYAQRASAGLIISEATSVSPMGVGYPDTPGIWSPEQVEGWKLVTRAVHNAGGRILLQLWHVGRMSDPLLLERRAAGRAQRHRPRRPLEPAAAPEAVRHPPGARDGEIPGIVEEYRQGAENAQLAGFDGVEIHGANGYLLDQFLQDSSNHRTDEYGGPIENRARLMLEVADAAVSVWGPGRVGMHLAPRGDVHSMGDSDPPRRSAMLRGSSAAGGLAFLCVRESLGEGRIGPELKAAFGGAYIANEKFTRAAAEQVLATARPTPSPSASSSSPTRTCPTASRSTPRSTSQTPRRSTPSGPAGYTDYPFLDRAVRTA